MLRHRTNFNNWSISTKVTVIFMLAVVLPILLVFLPLIRNRQNAIAREQNETRLATLGPFEIARAEQTLQSLSAALTRLISDPTGYSQIERYLFLAPTGITTEEFNLLRRAIETRLIRFLSTYKSLSRIRFFDRDGNLIADAVQDGGVFVVVYEAVPGGETLTEPLIRAGELGKRTTVTDIYLDRNQNPSIDIILTFLPTWDVASISIPTGYVVFTQNLLEAGRVDTLPSLYLTLAQFPRSEQATSVFLLNRSGQLVSPATGLAWLTDARRSEGFRAAQRGETGVSVYDSPMLGEEVIGYHSRVTFPDGPQWTFIVETPMREVIGRVAHETLIATVLVAGGVLLLGLGATIIGTLVIARPITRLTASARQIAAGNLDTRLPVMTRQDEIGVLNNTLSEMSNQLLTAIQALERGVAERTRNLESILEIGRVLTSIRDRDILMEEIVSLIEQRFESIYHVQIFLIDERSNQARLKASTGAAGRALLERGHYLDVGSQSVIGSVTASGHAVVALDTSNNPIHKRNEFLPDTRAEMALPLRIEGHIIGALDLQSTQPDAFNEQDVELFQGMADQIAIALENAGLFAESKARLEEIENLNRLLSRSSWQEVTQSRAPGQLSATAGYEAGDDGWSSLQIEAMRTKEIAERIEGELVTFAVPVLLRGEVLGAVEWQVPQARYTGNVRQTALELTEHLALTADNIRLFEQSRRTAQREFLVNQISAQLTGTTNIDQILQTAVRELGLALRARQTAIRLTTSAHQPGQPAVKPVDR